MDRWQVGSVDTTSAPRRAPCVPISPLHTAARHAQAAMGDYDFSSIKTTVVRRSLRLAGQPVPPPWGELPDLAVECVIEHLDPLDKAAARLVGRVWRRAARASEREISQDRLKLFPSMVLTADVSDTFVQWALESIRVTPECRSCLVYLQPPRNAPLTSAYINLSLWRLAIMHGYPASREISLTVRDMPLARAAWCGALIGVSLLRDLTTNKAREFLAVILDDQQQVRVPHGVQLRRNGFPHTYLAEAVRFLEFHRAREGNRQREVEMEMLQVQLELLDSAGIHIIDIDPRVHFASGDAMDASWKIDRENGPLEFYQWHVTVACAVDGERCRVDAATLPHGHRKQGHLVLRLPVLSRQKFSELLVLCVHHRNCCPTHHQLLHYHGVADRDMALTNSFGLLLHCWLCLVKLNALKLRQSRARRGGNFTGFRSS